MDKEIFKKTVENFRKQSVLPASPGCSKSQTAEENDVEQFLERLKQKERENELLKLQLKQAQKSSSRKKLFADGK